MIFCHPYSKMQEENHFIETTSGWSSDFSLVFLEQGFLYNDFFAIRIADSWKKIIL